MQKLSYKSIQGHYKQLLADVRKKDTDLVTSLNDAINSFQGSELKEVAPAAVEVLVKPLELAIQGKNAKIFQPALSIIQVLAASNLLPFPHKVSFLEAAIKLLDASDDMVPIKVIQILLIMLTRQDVAKYPLANKILALCLKAFGSKSQIIKNNVFAVLRQTYSLLFEQYVADRSKLQARIEESEIHKVCVEQIEQLIAIAGEQYKYTNFKGLGMDLLTVILAETQGQLANSPRIVELFEKTYSPYLKNYMVNETGSFPLITRAVKSATQLILTLQTSYSLVHPILALSGSTYSWQRYLALEAFCTLFAEYRQIQHMHGMINNLLGELMNAIVSIAPKLPERTAEDSVAKLNLTRGSKVHELSEALACEPPIPSPSQYLALLCETLGNFVENLEGLFTAEKIKLGEPATQPFTVRQTEQAVDILDYTWKPVHEMLEYTLKTSDNEMQVQQTLHNIQSLVNMAGSVGLSLALQSIVGNLCNWQLPADLDENTWEVGYKHIYVCNAIFNVAQCLNKILDQKAWVHVFNALQKIAACVRRVEGDMAGPQEPQPLNFHVIGKRVAENMSRYLPKGVTPEQLRSTMRKSSELSAGTGEGRAEEGKNREEERCSEDPSSPFRTSSISDEEEKESHIQQIRRFSIKTVTTPIVVDPKHEIAPAVPLKLVPPDASINFYRMNSMVKREDMSQSFGKPKDLISAGGKKIPRIGNLHGEVESMKSSLESLFVLTIFFDDHSLCEFVSALGQITINSIEGLATSSPKGKHTEVKDWKKMNLFGLTRMLETVVTNAFRAHLVWNFVDSHMEALESSKFVQLRPLAIDAITCLIINIFDSHKDQAGDPHVLHWDNNEWQAVILTPLMNAVLTGHAECIKQVIANLGPIIENCGPYIAKEGWELVLGIVEKIVTTAQGSGNVAETTERIEQAFKCVELIIHNSLHRVHISNLATLVAVIHYFTTLRQNLNVSLLAVGFIHNVADYVCQQQLTGKLSGISAEKINEIWTNLLNRLKEIGNDERGELRHAAYRTLEQILTGHAEIISPTIWTYMLTDVCAQLLRAGKLQYFACVKGLVPEKQKSSPESYHSSQRDACLTGSRGKMKSAKSDKESAKKETEEEEKLREKSWEESITILHSTVIRVLKKLYSIEGGSASKKERAELIDKAWTLLLEAWADMAKCGSSDILSTIYKSIQQMAGKCRECVYKRFDELWRVFTDSVDCIVSEKPDPHMHSRSLVVKLSPTLVETFKCIFTGEVAKEYPTVISTKVQTSLLDLLKKLLTATSKAEGVHGISSPIKLLLEEKAMFDFVEYLPSIYSKQESYTAYFSYLLDMLTFRMDDPHSDAFVRRALEIIKDFIILREMPAGLARVLVPQLYPRFAAVISLRFVNEACKTLLGNAKDAQPLWYDVGEKFVQISTYLVNPQMFKEKYEENSTAEGKLMPTESFEKRKKELLENKELQGVVWENIIRLIKEMLKVSDSSLNALDKALAENVIKKSQDLDVTLINFILKVLLPSSEGLGKENQQELINLIDNGCTAFYSSFNSSSSSQNRAGDSLSKFCISTLLSLCANESEEGKFAEIKRKIAAITTPVLINRCKAIFCRYMADEKRSGQVPLPKQRSADLIDLLEKLKETSIFPDALPKREGGIADLLAGRRAHLVYLLPEIVECISSREADLREAIKEILQEINRMLLGDIADMRKLLPESK